ncbi:MAG: dienelactone hydrolase family protein [Spirochaetaceae bacterium]|nr:MAG: dienelactone hydrolase family protein [Spirochaetaceae bacterium]
MNRRMKLVFIVPLVLLAGLLLGVTGVLALDVFFGAQASQVANYVFELEDGQELQAFVARPPQAFLDDADDLPVVMMFHEWWGLNGEIAELAMLLSFDGYIVVVPDAYQGRVARTVPGALALRLAVDMDRVRDDMVAVRQALGSIEGTNPARTAALGFCFGGDVAMDLVTTLPSDFVATVTLYGGLRSDPEDVRPLFGHGPVLGVFGETDPQISLERVDGFETALQEAMVNHRISVYPGVGHAFIQPDTIGDGAVVDEAWNELRGFLRTYLDPVSRQITYSRK